MRPRTDSLIDTHRGNETMKLTALKTLLRPTILTCLAVSMVLTLFAWNTRAASRTVILTTTTSTQDSGLLDVLVPMFEKRTGYTVKTISVGTGQALALAARGEADVTLAH